MTEPQLAIWSVQTVPGQPMMLSRKCPASRPDVTRHTRERGVSSEPQPVGFIAAADIASSAFAGDATRW
jgi:hypothetical protein